MTNKYLPLVLIAGVLLIGLLFFPHAQVAKKKPQTNKLVGKLFLLIKDDNETYSVGDEIVITLNAHSNGEKIGGYDSVLTYDTNIIKLKESKNLVPDLEMYVKERSDGVSVTHVRSLASQNEIIQNNEPIAELTFEILKTGLIHMDFLFTQGRTNDSNMVNTKAEDILGKATGLTILVGETMTFKLHQSITLPKTNIIVRLDDVEIPGKMCNDCQTIADFSVTRGKETQKFSFISGGFTGAFLEPQKAFSYVFDVTQITSSGVKIIIASEKL